MPLRTIVASALLIGLAGAAHASTITIGGESIASKLFTDNALNINFSGTNPAPIVGSDFSTSASVESSDILVFDFTDNTFENDTGHDLLIFTSGAADAPSISLSFGGPTIAAANLGTEIGNPLAPAGITTWGIELDDFGIGTGVDVGGFFLFNTAGNADAPDIFAIAAVNGVIVPLPMSGALLLGGLGMFAAARRRT